MKLNFKKSLFYFSLLLLFSFPQISLATSGSEEILKGINQTANTAGIQTTAGTSTTLASALGTVVNWLFGVIGIIFLTVVLIGAYQWMVAGGSEEKVGKAKGWIINGINGMIVVFLAYALAFVIFNALGKATNVVS